jgi:hypothetical protein
MRSNNFFDQINDELGDAIRIAQIGLTLAGIIIVLAVAWLVFGCP